MQNIYNKFSNHSRQAQFQQKEDEIFSKARAVEKELLNLRQEKIDYLTKMFYDQLSQETEKEIFDYSEKLNEQIKGQITELTKEKNQKIQQMDNLKKKINDHIETLKLIIEDLSEKGEELETAYLAGIEYLRREKIENCNTFKEKLKRIQETKLSDFKNELEKVENI